MKEIAIYGKGGIGKSTISANISATFGKKGQKVVQIGCDPKHDSTRLLLHGENIVTVLDYLKETPSSEQKLEDIVYTGAFGIHCVEAGGPEPGVGCAGRGILSTFETLSRLGLDTKSYDLVLYDVLGDVVCGGFAVPLRAEYAKKVYIVTSGEYMSIYAANNILRGLKNYETDEHRAGGLIYNSRGIDDEYDRVERFSQAVGLPIIAKFPRSKEFFLAEEDSLTLVEKFGDSKIAEDFKKLCDFIEHQEILYEAKSLSDEELESVVLGTVKKAEKTFEKTKALEVEDRKKEYYSKSLMSKEPLHGCAYNGAMNMVSQIKDCLLISHGPKSCAHLSAQTISSIGRRTFLERGVILPTQVFPKIVSTEMDEQSMIFGGLEKLEETLKDIDYRRIKSAALITTCPSGIIGDDILKVNLPEDVDIPLVRIGTDGNISGDYMQGMIMSYKAVAEALVDNEVELQEDYVNIIGEKPIANSAEPNFNLVESWLNTLGLKINCRFLRDTSTESIINMKGAGLNILAHRDLMGSILQDFFQSNYNMEFFPFAFPIGFDESVEFLQELGSHYGREDKVREIIKRESKDYRREIDSLKSSLQGKKLMLIAYNHQIDWILKTALDLDMEIVKLGILDFSQDFDFKSKYLDHIGEFEENYKYDQRGRDIERLKPDLLLSNYVGDENYSGLKIDQVPLSPKAGFLSGVELAQRWEQLFAIDLKEGWKKDEELYRKYYA